MPSVHCLSSTKNQMLRIYMYMYGLIVSLTESEAPVIVVTRYSASSRKSTSDTNGWIRKSPTFGRGMKG